MTAHAIRVCTLAASILTFGGPAMHAEAPSDLDVRTAERLARLALDCVHREYPNKIAHVMQSDGDALPPRKLTPAFYGCFDWHSAVHGHWMLARLARLLPDAPFAADARSALERSLTTENIAGEVRYIEGEGRNSFERPYGLAWLLQLAAELREWRDDPRAARWSVSLEPLERAVIGRVNEWLPKLSHPIRVGEHDQTAFAFGLMLDWARVAEDAETTALLERRIGELYLSDRDCPMRYEPSGHDFLSPCLAEADLLRRVLEPTAFAAWLGAFLPGLPIDGRDDWLEPAVVSDPTDGKLVHLDGLNLSRAWMLQGIAAALPEKDPRRSGIESAASAHAESGLASITADNYEGGHWLGSFAVYLLTARGLH